MDKASPPERLKTLLPAVWALIKPRKSLMLAGLWIDDYHRVCGLALPVSTKYLIDNVMRRGQLNLLVAHCAGGGLCHGHSRRYFVWVDADAVQSRQQLIYEMRVQIQEQSAGCRFRSMIPPKPVRCSRAS